MRVVFIALCLAVLAVAAGVAVYWTRGDGRVVGRYVLDPAQSTMADAAWIELKADHTMQVAQGGSLIEGRWRYRGGDVDMLLRWLEQKLAEVEQGGNPTTEG